MLGLAIYFVVGCLAGAVAGGWRPFLAQVLDGTGKGRIISAAVCGGALALGALSHGSATLALAALGSVITLLASEFLPHDPWQKIGAPVSYGGSRSPSLYALAAVVGVLQLGLIILPVLWARHSWDALPMALLGVWVVPAYMLGNILPYPLLTIGKNGLVDAPTRWGEMFTRGGFLVVAGALVSGLA